MAPTSYLVELLYTVIVPGIIQPKYVRRGVGKNNKKIRKYMLILDVENEGKKSEQTTKEFITIYWLDP